MIATVATMIAFAMLFALFGLSGAADNGKGCSECSHSGSPECGSGCPLLEE